MEEFTIIQFNTKRSQRIPKRTARIHNKKGSRLIAFSYDISKELKAAGATHLNIVRSNLNGEIYLRFSSEGLIELKQTSKYHDGLVARNAEAVDYLISLYGGGEATQQMDIKLSDNQSPISGIVCYRITK